MVQKGGSLGDSFRRRGKVQNKNMTRMEEERERDLELLAKFNHNVTPGDREAPEGKIITHCKDTNANNFEGEAACQTALFRQLGLSGGKSKSRKNKKRVGKKGAKKTTRARKTSKARKTSRSRKYKK